MSIDRIGLILNQLGSGLSIASVRKRRGGHGSRTIHIFRIRNQRERSCSGRHRTHPRAIWVGRRPPISAHAHPFQRLPASSYADLHCLRRCHNCRSSNIANCRFASRTNSTCCSFQRGYRYELCNDKKRECDSDHLIVSSNQPTTLNEPIRVEHRPFVRLARPSERQSPCSSIPPLCYV